jgi:hypothetical protein
MTTTDVAGLPAELRAVLARVQLSQESACDIAEIPRTTYYRRLRQGPATWPLGELERFLAAAGYTLRLELDPLPASAPAVPGV